MIPPRETPEFSVIVPIAPGARPLVLESLHALEVGEDAMALHEVLVQTGPNPSRNRNEQARLARARILAFTDDDCRVAPDWLVRAAAFFQAHPDYDVVGGPQLDAADEGVLGRASGRALASWFGSWHHCRRYKRAAPNPRATQRDLTSANLFLTRDAFDRWGPFDERLWPNEETALLARIERDGGRIAYDPSIVVFHRRRPSLPALARQCFGYGRGRARQSYLEGGPRPALAQAVPILFLAYLVLLTLLPLLISLSALWLAPLALYATIALVVATISGLSEADPRAALLMPCAFLVIHTSYAAGLLLERVRLGLLGGAPAPAGQETTDAPSEGSAATTTQGAGERKMRAAG